MHSGPGLSVTRYELFSSSLVLMGFSQTMEYYDAFSKVVKDVSDFAVRVGHRL